MFSSRVDKVTGARAHEHEDGNRQLGQGVADELDVGGGAAVREVSAQLDAIRTALGGGTRGSERLDGRLDEYGHDGNSSRNSI